MSELTEDQLDQIAELVIQKMTERAYIQVGKKVVSGVGKFFFYVGIVTFALYSILKTKGII
jgi:hypothetical protein